eukprot:CAMPEP_0119388090 /NCGR_PEP_ID=MMETSP1334-20130426/103516_1 /TAXON_ID=127549 /ORGANISM="Calcidiscus leptoporus, Strain RCC1130" /LENGTH=33 /DNA_ID= /DNA_START= /DNA_END= /DNA_ORIENTATION=
MCAHEAYGSSPPSARREASPHVRHAAPLAAQPA